MLIATSISNIWILACHWRFLHFHYLKYQISKLKYMLPDAPFFIKCKEMMMLKYINVSNLSHFLSYFCSRFFHYTNWNVKSGNVINQRIKIANPQNLTVKFPMVINYRNILSLVEGMLIRNGEICKNATIELDNMGVQDPLLYEFPIWVHLGTSVR